MRVTDNAPGAVVEILPEIAVHRDPATDLLSVFSVWQELATGTGLEDGRIILARCDWALARVDDTDRRMDDFDGTGKWHPVVVATGKRGNPLLVWVDGRDDAPRSEIFAHLFAAKGRGRRGPDGRTVLSFIKPRPVVREKDVDVLAAQLANERAPALAYGDRRVVLGWLNFRQYNWDVYSSFSRTGLRYSRPPLRVEDSVEFERLNSHTSLA